MADPRTPGTGVSVDRDGRLHVAALKAIPEPPSLTDLRKRVEAMLPRVDLPEVILEVMSWESAFTAAFTSITGGRARLAGLGTSIAAYLAAHAMNIGFAPVITRGVPALERDRLVHVDHTYLCAENYAAANAYLIEAQARIPLAADYGRLSRAEPAVRCGRRRGPSRTRTPWAASEPPSATASGAARRFRLRASTSGP